MTHFEDELTSKDGTRLYFQGWAPAGAPQAVICLAHGLGEHSGRYAHVAQRFTGADFAMLAIDQRGHGRTPGRRGHIPGGGAVLDDLDALLAEAARRYPGAPRFLYGHSMGGILVLYYTTARRPDLAGVVATSPGLRTALEKQKLKVALSKALVRFLPQLSLPTGLDAAQISRDAEVVRIYQADPLVHGVATVSLAATLLEAIEFAYAHAPEFTPPLLLVHGEDDQIAYARGSREFAALAPHATLKLWPGLLHETHNEPEKQQVLAYTLEWIQARLAEAQRSPANINQNV